ncbi:MAG: redox-sensing transcriptional repressor Rex [Gemmatimonadetes bacterium]|nr:redox-sensing transcriptional repressor Rex [Gemmatimonadota bacterium]
MSGRISDSTVRRLSLYLRMLRDLERAGVELVSSAELAERAGATSAQVRKDLSLFGSFGKRGRGYLVGPLSDTLEEILGLDHAWKVALVGVGKIGSALLGYRDLSPRGFDVVAAFDVDPSKIGERVFGLSVRSLDELGETVSARGVEIGIVATPPQVAEDVARDLARAGVGAILNFAPVELGSVDGVPVRTVDIVLELEGLSYVLAAARRGAERSREGA